MENKISTKSSVQNEEARMDNTEISLKDIMDFIKRDRKRIALWGLAGLMFSAAYVVLTPKKYEAKWQIQMSQFANISSTSTSISFSNIEEPAALIQRLRTPTAYPVAVQQSCGMPVGGEFGEYLGGTLKIQAVKNVPADAEMEFRAGSPLQANQCAEAITMMIVEQQRGLIEDHLTGRQEQLLQYQQALREERRQLETIQKSELGNFGYLAKLDTLSWLRMRIMALQEEVMLSQKHPARLVAPIFVPSKPVSSKVGLLLFLGVSLGFMLGVLYALWRKEWRKTSKSNS